MHRVNPAYLREWGVVIFLRPRAWLLATLRARGPYASGGVSRSGSSENEVLFQAARPLLVNGIEDVISRSDLADRSIFLIFPPVADARQKSPRACWAACVARRCSCGHWASRLLQSRRPSWKQRHADACKIPSVPSASSVLPVLGPEPTLLDQRTNMSHADDADGADAFGELPNAGRSSPRRTLNVWLECRVRWPPCLGHERGGVPEEAP